MRRWVRGEGGNDSRDGGFSLIELLVVIVIIAVLAMVVILAVGGIKDKGEKSSCSEDFRTIQTAEEAFFASPASGGSYTDMAGLVSAHLLTEPSTLFDVAPVGSTYAITAITNNPNGCTDPNA